MPLGKLMALDLALENARIKTPSLAFYLTPIRWKQVALRRALRRKALPSQGGWLRAGRAGLLVEDLAELLGMRQLNWEWDAEPRMRPLRHEQLDAGWGAVPLLGMDLQQLHREAMVNGERVALRRIRQLKAPPPKAGLAVLILVV